MIIDCHAHGFPLQDVNEVDIYEARKLGIGAVCVIGPGEDVMATAAQMGSFIRPIVQIDMARALTSDVRRWRTAKAIKFTMPGEPYSAPRYWPLYDACVEEGLVAVFHSGYLGFYGSESLCVHMKDTQPSELDWIARNWPELQIVMAHFGNPYWDDAFKVVAANANIYADLSGGSAYRRDMADWARLFAPNGQPRRDVLSKLMFGTDKTLHKDYNQRAPGYIRFYSDLFFKIGLDSATADLIWQGNAARLFA